MCNLLGWQLKQMISFNRKTLTRHMKEAHNVEGGGLEEEPRVTEGQQKPFECGVCHQGFGLKSVPFI